MSEVTTGQRSRWFLSFKCLKTWWHCYLHRMARSWWRMYVARQPWQCFSKVNSNVTLNLTWAWQCIDIVAWHMFCAGCRDAVSSQLAEERWIAPSEWGGIGELNFWKTEKSDTRLEHFSPTSASDWRNDFVSLYNGGSSKLNEIQAFHIVCFIGVALQLGRSRWGRVVPLTY